MVFQIPALWGGFAETETYDTVWLVWQKEKQTTKLQQIPKTFYKDVFDYLDKTNKPTDTESTTKENTKRLLNNIYERRKQKILAYLAYNQQPPQPMPPEEERFYTNLYATIKNDRLGDKSVLGALTALHDTPKIILPSGVEVGPLMKDQTVLIDSTQDTEFLLSNNLCRTG